MKMQIAGHTKCMAISVKSEVETREQYMEKEKTD